MSHITLLSVAYQERHQTCLYKQELHKTFERVIIRDIMKLELKQTTPLVQQEDGTVHIIGSRITLDTLVRIYKKGATAEQIQDSFPSLSLKDIYATIAFYLEHKTDVESYLKQRHEEANELRLKIESELDAESFRARMRERREQLIHS